MLKIGALVRIIRDDNMGMNFTGFVGKITHINGTRYEVTGPTWGAWFDADQLEVVG